MFASAHNGTSGAVLKLCKSVLYVNPPAYRDRTCFGEYPAPAPAAWRLTLAICREPGGAICRISGAKLWSTPEASASHIRVPTATPQIGGKVNGRLTFLPLQWRLILCLSAENRETALLQGSGF